MIVVDLRTSTREPPPSSALPPCGSVGPLEVKCWVWLNLLGWVLKAVLYVAERWRWRPPPPLDLGSQTRSPLANCIWGILLSTFLWRKAWTGVVIIIIIINNNNQSPLTWRDKIVQAGECWDLPCFSCLPPPSLASVSPSGCWLDVISGDELHLPPGLSCGWSTGLQEAAFKPALNKQSPPARGLYPVGSSARSCRAPGSRWGWSSQLGWNITHVYCASAMQ